MAWYGSIAKKRGAKEEVKKPKERKLPPFPVRQMIVLSLCRFSEPVAFMSIFPYIYYMVQDFHITEDRSKISFYAGMVTSAFTFAEFSTGFLWGRLSDKVGRKKILLTGLIGTGISSLLFGFSTNFGMALFARALGGALNGNIGVLQTTVAELVPVREYQPRAFSIMPLVWCIGSIFGPVIGGALARPCDSFPDYFPRGSVWDRYPYLLPNLFSVVVVCAGVVIGILFLEETHRELRHERDRGIELGNRLGSLVTRPWNLPSCLGRGGIGKRRKEEKLPLLAALGEAGEEYEALGEDDDDVVAAAGAAGSGRRRHDDDSEQLPCYRSSGRSPQLDDALHPGATDPRDTTMRLDATPEGDPAARTTTTQSAKKSSLVAHSDEEDTSKGPFTRNVIMVILSYGLLAFHTITFDQLLPVFLSTKITGEKTPVELPFHFAEGLEMDSKTVGIILAVQGFWSMIATVQVFPMISQWMGPFYIYKVLSVLYFPCYFFTPYLVLLPDSVRLYFIYVIVIWKSSLSSMSFPANAMIITNTSPGMLSLGTINGVAASTASLCRAFGPSVSGLLYAWGLDVGYSGLPWWAAALASLLGAYFSLCIVEPPNRDQRSDDDEEAGLLIEDDTGEDGPDGTLPALAESSRVAASRPVAV